MKIKPNHLKSFLILLIAFLHFYGMEREIEFFVNASFFLLIAMCGYFDYRYQDMEKRKEKRREQVERLQEIYKELELGVKKNAFRH